MAKEKPKDLFMQFAAVTVPLDGTDTSVLQESRIDTGLSIRGEFIWLIHLIEMDLTQKDADGSITAVLSSVPNQASLPTIVDRGTVTWMKLGTKFDTEGRSVIESPKKAIYLPPIPYASPTLSLYAKTSAHEAGIIGAVQECRIGYTTLPITKEIYLEIAEVWERLT